MSNTLDQNVHINHINEIVLRTVYNGELEGFIKKSLQKKLSFPLRISSVNVTKSAGKCGFGHIY